MINKKILSLFMVALCSLLLTIPCYASITDLPDIPAFKEKTEDKGVLISTLTYDTLINGLEATVTENTYLSTSNTRAAKVTYYRETFYSVEYIGLMKLDADFVVEGGEITCPRYYSSYTEKWSVDTNPYETGAKFRNYTSLTYGKCYEIKTTYTYRMGAIGTYLNFNMRLASNIGGGTV